MLTLKEVAMVEQLAEDEGVTVSQAIRSMIKTEHIKRFGREATPRATSPTLRGILKDLTGRAHYTVGNISERSTLDVAKLLRALQMLSRAGIVVSVDGSGVNSTWESKFPTYEATIEAAMAKKLDLDVAL